jgi:hypothetical protein
MKSALTILFILSFSVLVCAGIADGLVAYYPFNGNANDESGYGNHGTVYGAALSPDRFDNPNRCYRFDGSNDYITAGTVNYTLPVSVSLWFKSTVVNLGWHSIFAWNQNFYPQNGIQFYAAANGLISVRIGFGSDRNTQSRIDGDGAWHHMVAHRGLDDTLRIYVDGFLETTSLSTAIIGTNHIQYFGRSYQPNQFFNGWIDDIRVYNRVLSETEIRELYTGYSPNRVTLIPVNSPTLNRRPEFRWHSLDSAQSYRIQIDTVSTFQNPLASIVVGDTVFTPLADLPKGTIYWLVTANPYSFYSDIGSFVVLDSLVPIPIPYTPSPTRERRPELSWHSVKGASSYHIVIDNDSSFTSPVISISITDTTFRPMADLPFGMIYWKVKSDLIDEYCPATSFYIQPDTIPFLYTFNGSIETVSRPLFRWQPVAGATTYRIQIDTSANFLSPMTSVMVGDTLFAPLTDLTNGMYYWRVSCDLNLALFSRVDSVIVDTSHVRANAKRAVRGGALAVYPTPFKPVTTIYLPATARNVDVEIYSIAGKSVAAFRNVRHGALRWDASGLPSGIYVVRANVGDKVYARRICLLK